MPVKLIFLSILFAKENEMSVTTVEIIKELAAFNPNAYANEFQQSSIH